MSYNPFGSTPSDMGGYAQPPAGGYMAGGPPVGPPIGHFNPHAAHAQAPPAGVAPTYERYPPPPPRVDDYQQQQQQQRGRNGFSPPRGPQTYPRQARRRSASPSYDRGGGYRERDDAGGAYDGGHHRGRGGGYAARGAGRGRGRGGYNAGIEDRTGPYGRRSHDRHDEYDGMSLNQMHEDRAQRERPGRTLFVRNLKFGVTPDQVRDTFAAIGDIKTFFDLVEKRAMAFITYYDARAALMAKDRLHDSMLAGRPMDVHFSLPRDQDLSQECDRDKGQGTLSLVILPFVGARINQALPPPTDAEVYERFAPFGDLKSVFPAFKRQEMRYVEYFDSRGTCLAFDKVNGTRMAGGIADLRFVWDKYPMDPSKPPPRSSNQNNNFEGSRYGDNRSQREGPPPQPSYGSERDRYGPPPSVGGYNDRPPPPQPPSGYGTPPPMPTGPPAYGNYPGPPAPASGYGGPPPSGPYGNMSPPQPSAYGNNNNRAPLPPGPPGASPYQDHYNQHGGTPMPPPLAQSPIVPAPPAPPAQNPGHGVEQAKKMQQLLANLMSSNPNALSGVAIPPPPPPQHEPQPVDPRSSLQSPGSDSVPGGNSTPLPAAVSSLLAQAGVPPSPSTPTVSQSSLGTAPSEIANPPPAQEQVGNGQVQALLALLAQQNAQAHQG
ncbi:uncharacterized protein JCM15063_002497 [Sporobolomyces koalae]|uniref:uncharacterized protein n=1 Tax=Sporobolomyces koalae TaxID=500713 RepID=UPI003176F335